MGEERRRKKRRRKQVWFSIISVETAPAVAVGLRGGFQGKVFFRSFFQPRNGITLKYRRWKTKRKRVILTLYRRDLYLLIKRPGRAGNSPGIKGKGICVQEDSLWSVTPTDYPISWAGSSCWAIRELWEGEQQQGCVSCGSSFPLSKGSC